MIFINMLKGTKKTAIVMSLKILFIRIEDFMIVATSI